MRRGIFPIAKIVLLTLARAVIPRTALAGGRHDSGLNPCAPPNEILSSIEETAWRIWVAATCPVNATSIRSSSGRTGSSSRNYIRRSVARAQGAEFRRADGRHPLHESPLALAINPGLGEVRGAGGAGHQLQQGARRHRPTPPPAPNLVICEEVRENGATEDYIAGTGFWNRTAQAAAAERDDIQFPRPAVEIKADWILSWIGDPHRLRNLPAGSHVETINGNCYAWRACI